MSNELAVSVLEDCISAFKIAHTGLFEATHLLYRIRKEDLWEGHHSSFSDFLEECGISRGYASRLLTAYEHFVIEGGVSQRNLQGIDPEKLYLATKLTGSTDEQLTKALTLTRSELRLEHSDEKPHDHQWIEICTICHLRKLQP